ncbi:MAG: hypothetical protein CMP07_06265 [Xanthomonadales bacterium]|nr:hypothetical protein [Xanthomonadales bacterium]
MRTFRRIQALLALTMLAWTCAAPAQETTFTYQGELLEAGAPADGLFDFQIALFDVASGGISLAPDEVFVNQAVNDGLFQLDLNFGAALLLDSELWLEIRVRRPGQPAFTLLNPRLEVNAAPRAALGLVADVDAVGPSSLASGAITSADIANGAVGAAIIATNAVGANHIQDGAVGTARIRPGAVGASQIAAGAVGASEIADTAVGASEIATDAVGTSEIAPDAIGSAEIANDAVGNSHIAAGVVGTAAIATGAVGTDELAGAAVGVSDINTNEVQARVLGCNSGSAIRAVQANGTVICEPDSRGITGFGSPVTSLFASAFNGTGSVTRNLGAISDSLCMLSLVDFAELDTSAEFARCRIFISNGDWILEAFSTEGRDNDAVCQAVCMAIVTAP